MSVFFVLVYTYTKLTWFINVDMTYVVFSSMQVLCIIIYYVMSSLQLVWFSSSQLISIHQFELTLWSIYICTKSTYISMYMYKLGICMCLYWSWLSTGTRIYWTLYIYTYTVQCISIYIVWYVYTYMIWYVHIYIFEFTYYTYTVQCVHAYTAQCVYTYRYTVHCV